MNKKDALQLIDIHFPSLRYTKSTLITDGWDNDVLLLDDTWIFRIPRDAAERPLLLAEATLLDILHHEEGIEHIPVYEYLEPHGVLGGYKKLHGIHPHAETVATWDDAEKKLFGTQLGLFLKQVHGVDVTIVSPYVQPVDLHENIQELESDMHSLQAQVPSKELFDQAARILAEAMAVLQADSTKVLVHRDMNPGNLLWDTNNKILNVIDFSDRAIAHPGIDMAYLFDYDEIVRDSFVAAYGPSAQTYLVFAKLAYHCIGLRVFRAAMQGSANVTKEEGIDILTKKLSV